MMDNGIHLLSSDSAMTSKENKNRCATFKIRIKYIVYILKQRMMHCLRIAKKTCLCTKAIKFHAQKCSGQIISPVT